MSNATAQAETTRQPVTVGRIVHVYRRGPKAWSGPRTGIVTGVGEGGGGGVNVSVVMDHADDASPPVVRLANLPVFDAGEVDREKVTEGAWCEWPPVVKAAGKESHAEAQRPQSRAS